MVKSNGSSLGAQAKTNGNGNGQEYELGAQKPDDSAPTPTPFADNGSPTTSKKYQDFDDVLEVVGSEGKYQRFLLFAVMCPIITVQPIFTLNALFMLNEPNHWCAVPGNTNNSLPANEWKNLTIPWYISPYQFIVELLMDVWTNCFVLCFCKEVGPDSLPRHSRCKMFESFSNHTPVACRNGWEYDKSDYDATIPSQFNWVCDRDHYATDALTLYAVGNCIGTLVLGWGADKYGRKPIFFICVFINTFFRGVSLFVPQSITAFLILQLIIGIAFPMMYITPNMIVAEVASKKYRGYIYAVGWVIWVLGMASLPLIAWLTRHWFTIGVITSVPGVFLFLYYRALPESPRWLVSVGKTKEAAVVLQKIAKDNGNQDKISNDKLESMLEAIVAAQEKEAIESGDGGKSGVWTLFSKFTLAKNTVMLTTSWSINALIYYAVTINASNMSGNQFLNFFLLAIIEVPAGWLGGYLVEVTGRRWTQVAFFGVGMIAFIVASIGVAFPTLSPAVITSIIVAKFCVTLTFLVVYLQGAEIFPTKLRSTGSGFASTISSGVGILGPYLVFLAKFDAAAPYYALAALAALGLLASAYLPETHRQSLPETLDEANSFGKGVKFWSYLPSPPSKRRRSGGGGAENETRA